MPMTIREWKEAEVKGYDVFLETGVRIKGFKCINDKTRNEAIRKFIEILKADEVDFDYHEYKMED